MPYRLATRFVLSLLLAASGMFAAAAEPAPSRFYVIGNSLTWDTVPSKLSGDVQWHVDCGVSLPYIHANPGSPCVKASTIWPTALSEKQYDVISVQPHYRSTLTDDVETISKWMTMQPEAVFVIHSGWARSVSRAEEFADFHSPGEMTHSPVYIRALIAELQQRYPDREIRQTLAQNLLAYIADDIAAAKAPLEDLNSLYRDAIHLTVDGGRYLMHNAMRHALGQQPSAEGFETVTPEMKAYLDGVLSQLTTSPEDQALLKQILSVNATVDRASLAAQVSDESLRAKITALLPEIEQAAKLRRETLALEAKINAVGGQLICTPSGPQWLYLATADTGTEIFDVPATISLNNGNNPLKGKGGRNDQVTDEWLSHLSGLTTLRSLDLGNCAIQGDGLIHIAGLTALQELNLTLTPVTDTALQHLAELSDLRVLGLASTQCTGTGFTHLKKLKKLQDVNFHYTPLNDAGLEVISQVPISNRLWFAHTHFTDAGAACLKNQTLLKVCGIGSSDRGSSGEAVAALTAMPLEELSLLDNQATNVGLAHAAKISTLVRLYASHAPNVTDDALTDLAKMPKLQELTLGNAQISDAGLAALAESASLKQLSLHGLKQITPAGVQMLREKRPDLAIQVK